MITVLLVLQVFVTLALIGVVLIQRSEGGGLGLGSGQGMGNFMSGRGTANLLTRTTAVLATVFMALSLVLALLYQHGGNGGAVESILNGPASASKAAPAKPRMPAKPAANLPPIPGEAVLPSPSSSGASPAVPGTTENPTPLKNPAPTQSRAQPENPVPAQNPTPAQSTAPTQNKPTQQQ